LRNQVLKEFNRLFLCFLKEKSATLHRLFIEIINCDKSELKKEGRKARNVGLGVIFYSEEEKPSKNEK